MMSHDYGLELTSNSKVGWAFSLERSKSCIGATELCRKLCYGNNVRYQTAGQKAKRARNFRTVQLLLERGGPKLLAENLVMLVDQARPRDWLAAQVTGCATSVPWTLRIHDVGDFHSVEYVQAWLLAAKSRPHCAFWFYTRSFTQPDVLSMLGALARLDNVQGWLSVDSDNYSQAILALCDAPTGTWKLALLQDNDLHPDALPSIAEVAKNIVSFPYHRSGRHVTPIRHKVLTVCPAVTGSYELHNRVSEPKPCQACSFCLPALS